MNKLKIKFNEKYSHCTKLSKAHYELFLVFYKLNNDIRSPEIVQFICERYDISINRGWVNQKLAQCGCTRPRGRPTKEYEVKRLEYKVKLTKTADKIEQIGIPFLIDLMDSIGITDIFLEVLLELTVKYTSNFPKDRLALQRFIHTLYQIVLDPRVSNFEEAIRSEMPHKKMDIERSRQLIKACEKLGKLECKLSNGFMDFWIEKLALHDKVLSHFVDGHGAPYYTGQTFITGRMSVTQKIMPGTHYVIHTTEGGFILNICTQEADAHLNYGLHDECEILYKKLTGLVDLVVVDRECNGKEISQFIKENYGISILTGLRSNQYKTLSDFDYKWIQEGKLAYGKWHNLKK